MGDSSLRRQKIARKGIRASRAGVIAVLVSTQLFAPAAIAFTAPLPTDESLVDETALIHTSRLVSVHPFEIPNFSCGKLVLDKEHSVAP